MTLTSGVVPYNYDYGHGPFRVANPYNSNFPIGLSGVLLEQAQFVMTAEIRRMRTLLGNSHVLGSFNVYVNSAILPSGGYEPKANGSTLGNQVYPAAAFILDHIQETRIVLNALFQDYASDTNLDTYEYRAAWLQALYPSSPSGFYNGEDPDVILTVDGHWSHRFPSETGTINYVNDDVLGASGILYDVDIGELLINPAPHISRFGLDRMHAVDNFSVQQFPLFPGFQKTNGSLVPLTGREPSVIPTAQDYQIDHISSGAIRLDGYVIHTNTEIYLGRNLNIFGPAEDFNVVSEGHRQMVFAVALPGTRLFMTPVAQASGIYRVAVKNKRADFPNTTIESGKMSFWPNINHYWPRGANANDQLIGSTTTTSNLGYHVFNDCLWMTDVVMSSATTAKPSGLAILSPYTGHRMWVRYAEQTQFVSTELSVNNRNSDWARALGLVRDATNSIYRMHKDVQTTVTNVSGTFVFAQYNDMLDFTTTVTTGPAELPFAGDLLELEDFWYDNMNSEYWVSSHSVVDHPGFPFWKFDSSFQYINKYTYGSEYGANGITQSHGIFIGGQQYIFAGGSGVANSTGFGSGIVSLSIVSEGTDPYMTDGSAPSCGLVHAGPKKFIKGESFVGVQQSATILDMLEVTVASHVQVGVYALLSWSTPAPGSSTALYLVRIEETATAWEVKSISRMETSLSTVLLRDLLYMPY